MPSRRAFLTSALAAGLAPVVASARVDSLLAHAENAASPSKGFVRNDDFVIPPSLIKGSVIGVTAPASGSSQRELDDGIHFLRGLGFKVVLGRCLGRNRSYLSAPDSDRADEFNEFIQRPDINAIICARGGYGVTRILPQLNYDAIRSNPKPIVGYSDITAMLIAIHNLSKVVTFHGPVCSSTFDTVTSSSFVDVMMKPEEKRSGNRAFLTYSNPMLDPVVGGFAEGKLIGGNLSTICSTLGTPYQIDTEGAILFLEDVAEEPYKIDRMLTQLWLAGKFDKVKGVALGIFKNCSGVRVVRKRRRKATIQYSGTTSPVLREIFRSRLAPLGVPVLSDLPIGHIKSKLTLPLGVKAQLDCENRSFRIVEPSVA